MKKLTLASRRKLLTRVGAFALAPALSAGFSARRSKQFVVYA
ncbi:hypothetical protein [Burkholderia multivorans]|nr:hypothetical protein [Burkholderia multivorans]MDN7944576.1 hypothetical protein [Burkholderia multivorans]